MRSNRKSAIFPNLHFLASDHGTGSRPRSGKVSDPRTGGRVVECAGLEIRYTCKRIVSSNLTLSATHFEETKNSRLLGRLLRFCLCLIVVACSFPVLGEWAGLHQVRPVQPGHREDRDSRGTAQAVQAWGARRRPASVAACRRWLFRFLGPSIH